ncbi:MBL fold metallo-hydrolase [Halomonas beimenensis]|uniref:MBL fold metallo-hydrolase n=1 Tax=Halomonas beimenensis TaxID=475662 RepID=UPI003605E79A
MEKILLTHAHIDHAGGTAELSKEMGLPIEGPHKEDNFWIQAYPSRRRCSLSGAGGVHADRWLEDGEEVTVGNQTLEVLHCPGHTRGTSCSSTGNPAGMVGDVLFQGSIGRTDFPKGDYNTLIRSIREKLFPLGDEVSFIPGHGPMSTFGQERASNPFVSDHRS